MFARTKMPRQIPASLKFVFQLSLLIITRGSSLRFDSNSLVLVLTILFIFSSISSSRLRLSLSLHIATGSKRPTTSLLGRWSRLIILIPNRVLVGLALAGRGLADTLGLCIGWVSIVAGVVG